MFKKLPPIVIFVTIIALVIVPPLALGLRYEPVAMFEWPWPVWLRLAAAGGVAAMTLYLISAAFDAFKFRARRSWWDPADLVDGKLRWSDVLLLTQDDYDTDPLTSDRTLRGWQAVRDGAVVLIAFAILLCLAVAALSFVSHPPATQAAAGNNSSTSSAGLAAAFALVPVLLTIFFAYQQLKAKVRADNRQVWIGKLRTLIAEVTALADNHISASDDAKTKLWQELSAKRLELELMLNPSEKDHRLLMYLTQFLALFPGHDMAHIADAENVKMSIAKECGCHVDQLPDAWKAILFPDSKGVLIGYVMRLSHVVLKREWERVKRAR